MLIAAASVSSTAPTAAACCTGNETPGLSTSGASAHAAVTLGSMAALRAGSSITSLGSMQQVPTPSSIRRWESHVWKRSQKGWSVAKQGHAGRFLSPSASSTQYKQEIGEMSSRNSSASRMDTKLCTLASLCSASSSSSSSPASSWPSDISALTPHGAHRRHARKNEGRPLKLNTTNP